MERIFIGVDPGKEGGIIVLDENSNILEKYNIPKIKGTNEINLYELDQIFKNFPKDDSIVIMELVREIHGSAAKATFQFGRSFGILEMVIVSNGFIYSMVRPKKWQKEMLEGIPVIKKVDKETKKEKRTNDTKKMALIASTRLWPKYDFRRSEKCKKAHDGLVDAALLAEYLRRKYRGKNEEK